MDYDCDSLLLNNKMQLFCFYVSCYVTNYVFYMLELHELYSIRCVRVLSHTDNSNTLLLFNNNSVAERFTIIYQFIMYHHYYLCIIQSWKIIMKHVIFMFTHSFLALHHWAIYLYYSSIYLLIMFFFKMKLYSLLIIIISQITHIYNYKTKNHFLIIIYKNVCVGNAFIDHNESLSLFEFVITDYYVYVHVFQKSPYLFSNVIPRVNNMKCVTRIVYIPHSMSHGLTYLLNTLLSVQDNTVPCHNEQNLYMYSRITSVVTIPITSLIKTVDNIYKSNYQCCMEHLFELLLLRCIWKNTCMGHFQDRKSVV